MKTTKKKRKQTPPSKKKNNIIYTAAIAGIAACIIFIPFTILSIYIRALPSQSTSLLLGYYVINIIFLIVSITFLFGFIELGKKANVKQLAYISYLLIVITTLTIGIDSYTLVFSQGIEGTAYKTAMTSLLVATGIAGAFFGINLMKLKKSIPLARTAGILEIISGIAGATIVLIFVTLILVLPTLLIETIILFKAAKKYR